MNAQTQEEVGLSINQNEANPGEEVEITLTPSGISSFYAVQLDLDGLEFAGEHTADNNTDGLTFVMLSANNFTVRAVVPQNANHGDEFTIGGLFWSDPEDKKNIGTTQQITVPSDVPPDTQENVGLLTDKNEANPGEEVEITVTPSDIDSFYAVQFDLGGLEFTGEHTADNNTDSSTFVMLSAKNFTIKASVPQNANPGDEFIISGLFWSDPEDKKNIGTTQQITVPSDVPPDTQEKVELSANKSEAAPGEEVEIMVTPSEIDSFYAVQFDLGELEFTGEHTADNNPESLTFVMLSSQGFTLKVSVPQNAEADDEFILGGVFWSDPQDKKTIESALQITVSFPEIPSLSVTPDSQKILPEGGTTIFDVVNAGTGPMEWTAATEDSWLTIVSGSSATDSGRITVTYQPNNSGSERTGTITVTATGATNSPQSVKVIQPAMEPRVELLVKNEADPGEEIEITVVPSGIDSFYAVQLDMGGLEFTGEHTADEKADGLTFVMLSAQNFTVKAVVPQNTEPGGDFVIGGSFWEDPENKKEIKSVRVVYSGGFYKPGDIDYSGVVDLKDAILALKTAAGFTTDQVYIGADVNGDAKIGIEEVVYVLQMVAELTGDNDDLKPVLSVTPAFRDVSETSGTITFDVANTGTGTMNWTGTKDADWFSINLDSGTDNETITVSYESNTGDARTGAITITADGATDSPQTVEVRQAGDVEEISTNVGGVINADTIWTSANSPYTLTSDVQIAYGATLTIEEGVVINGEGLALKVWGNLNATGSETSKIMFDNVNITPGTHSDTDEVFSMNIQHSEINSGSLYTSIPNIGYGNLTLKDSKLTGIPYMYVYYPKTDCHIERNIFLKSGGISVGIRDDIKAYIRNNVFYGQTTDYAVENWASYGTSETVVEYNSFLSPDRAALRLRPGHSSSGMTAASNYWNTADTTEIDSMIYDKNDDLSCAGYIGYEPFLTEPHPDTPSESSDLGKNARVSGCGGFDAAMARDWMEDVYCRDERLIWQYDEASQTVSFLNKDVSLNCCGEHSVTVSLDKVTGVYEIKERDEASQMGRCSCLCFFDFGIDLPGVTSDTIRIKLSRLVIDYPYSMWEEPDSGKTESYPVVWEGELDLSRDKGDVLIRENGGYCR